MYIKSKAENFDSFYFRDFLVEQADFFIYFMNYFGWIYFF